MALQTATQLLRVLCLSGLILSVVSLALVRSASPVASLAA